MSKEITAAWIDRPANPRRVARIKYHTVICVFVTANRENRHQTFNADTESSRRTEACPNFSSVPLPATRLTFGERQQVLCVCEDESCRHGILWLANCLNKSSPREQELQSPH